MMDNIDCPCGGKAIYFGEALMGSLKCNTCGDRLVGVGMEFIRTIRERWLRGDRGWQDDYTDMKYYYLKKDEIIQPGDEVDSSADGWRDEPKWVPTKSIGDRAPDPSFPAHRIYRRKLTKEGALIPCSNVGSGSLSWCGECWTCKCREFCND